jgi:hypothetical protein
LSHFCWEWMLRTTVVCKTETATHS